MVGSRSRRLGERASGATSLRNRYRKPLNYTGKSGQRIGQALVSLRYVSEKDPAWALGEQARSRGGEPGRCTPSDPTSSGSSRRTRSALPAPATLPRERHADGLPVPTPSTCRRSMTSASLAAALRPVVAPDRRDQARPEHSCHGAPHPDSRDRDAEAASEEMDIADLEKMAGEAVVIRLVNVIFHQGGARRRQ